MLPSRGQGETTVVDLQWLEGEGELVIKPEAGGTWPKHLVLRVTPGTVRSLDITGDARLFTPIRADGPAPRDIPLLPGVYSHSTSELTVRWRP